MKKTLAAIAIGTLLVAGQAAAAGQGAATRVGDRVGAQAGDSSEFAGIPILGYLAIAGILAATISIVSDDSESD